MEEFNQVMWVSKQRLDYLTSISAQGRQANANFDSFSAAQGRVDTLTAKLDWLEDAQRQCTFQRRTWEQIRRRNESQLINRHSILDQIYEEIQMSDVDKERLELERTAIERILEKAAHQARAEMTHQEELQDLRILLLEAAQQMQESEARTIELILSNRQRQEEREKVAIEARKRREEKTNAVMAERRRREAQLMQQLEDMEVLVDRVRSRLGAPDAQSLLEMFAQQFGYTDTSRMEVQQAHEKLERLQRERERLLAQRALLTGHGEDGMSRRDMERPLEDLQSEVAKAEERATTLGKQLAAVQQRAATMVPAMQHMVLQLTAHVPHAMRMVQSVLTGSVPPSPIQPQRPSHTGTEQSSVRRSSPTPLPDVSLLLKDSSSLPSLARADRRLNLLTCSRAGPHRSRPLRTAPRLPRASLSTAWTSTWSERWRCLSGSSRQQSTAFCSSSARHRRQPAKRPLRYLAGAPAWSGHP